MLEVVEDATGEDATRREGPSAQRPRKRDDRLSRGTLLGRYVVLDVLGEGGMGVVYSAFDPELDRKVAVKLMQAHAAEHDTLLREAQAMARVTHPNVISVFDVGTLPGERVFVAMELVDGVTLRAWLRDKHPWREVLGVLRAAGAGLAAAHAAGLVHRDFKPDNVLVGKDGRVRVLDFGLAERTEGESVRVSSSDLTSDGYVVGTPAYLAPEIYKGGAADARSDQFAFGVALYEGLYGVRPFSKENRDTPKPPPADSRVPARVQRVVLRAIARDPAARYASVEELLGELAIDPFARRRRIALGAGVVGLAAFAVVASTVWRPSGPRCEGAEQRLAGVWDPPAKIAVNGSFLATKRPYAVKAYAGLARALDQYTHEWTAAVTEACEATRVRGEQSERVMTLREACLDQRLAELAALGQLLANADPALVEKGDKVVYELEPLEPCSNVAALLQPGLLPTEPHAKIEAYNHDLAEARAQAVAGHLLAALTASKRALATARELDNGAMIAWPEMVGAVSLQLAGNFEDSLPMMEDATWQAMRGKHDELVAQTALSNAGAMLTAGRVPEARIWLQLGKAAAHRVGVEHTLELRIGELEGLLAVQSHDMRAAIALHAKALEESELAYGHDSPAVWTEEELLAATLAQAEEYGEAAKHFERALALREQSVGPDHPDIALILSSMGVPYNNTGRSAQARAAYERALAIRERIYGKASPVLVVTLNNFADFLNQQGDSAAALQMIERARQIAEKAPGKDHPIYATIETTRAEILTSAQRYAEARAAFDELLALEEHLASPELPVTQASRAQLAVAERDWPTALAFADKAIATFEKGGKDSGELWRPLTSLGLAKLALGDKPAARAALERAVAIGEHIQLKASALRPARDALANLGP